MLIYNHDDSGRNNGREPSASRRSFSQIFSQVCYKTSILRIIVSIRPFISLGKIVVGCLLSCRGVGLIISIRFVLPSWFIDSCSSLICTECYHSMTLFVVCNDEVHFLLDLLAGDLYGLLHYIYIYLYKMRISHCQIQNELEKMV